VKSVLVFSSGPGALGTDRRTSTGRCPCKAAEVVPPGPGVVKVSRDTKGRKGKGVTLISGVPGDAGGLAALAGELKRRCGSGGTVKDGVIEIQGDHRDRLIEELQRRGYRVKRVGG
jgi:translation initiation factor 1